ncbi:hypothetical protein HK101_010872, partial [Irineochytrium annulatum]
MLWTLPTALAALLPLLPLIHAGQLPIGQTYDGHVTYYGHNVGDPPPVPPAGTGACGMTQSGGDGAGYLPTETYFAALSMDLYGSTKSSHWYSDACGQCALVTTPSNQEGVIVAIVGEPLS